MTPNWPSNRAKLAHTPAKSPTRPWRQLSSASNSLGLDIDRLAAWPFFHFSSLRRTGGSFNRTIDALELRSVSGTSFWPGTMHARNICPCQCQCRSIDIGMDTGRSVIGTRRLHPRHLPRQSHQTLEKYGFRYTALTALYRAARSCPA